MNWCICVLGILVIAQSEAFLFDPPIPSPTARYLPTGPSTTPDFDKLLRCADAIQKCMEPFKAIVNFTDLHNIAHSDTEAVVNFTCSEDGEKVFRCVNGIADCDYTIYTSGQMAPIESTRQLCKNDRPTLVGTSKCQKKFIGSDAFQSCYDDAIENNQTQPDGTECVIFRGILDCHYKYVNLLCPEYWSFFESQMRAAYKRPCQIITGSSPTATTCDDKMMLTCVTDRPDPSDTDDTVDFYCSEDGKQSDSCLERYKALCGHTNIVKHSPLETISTPANRGFLCQENKHDYKTFLTCTSDMKNNSDYQLCMWTPQGSGYVDHLSCRYQQTVTQCVRFALLLSDHCYSSLVFYDKLLKYIDTQNLTDCALGNDTALYPSAYTADPCYNVAEACFSGVDLNDLTDTRAVSEHMCRSGGQPFSDCVSRQCGPNGTDLYPNIDQLAIVCQDKDGYVAFGTCFITVSNSTDFKNCVNISNDAALTEAEKCRIVQRTYDCSVTALATTCPSVMPFFNGVGLQYFNLSSYGKRCHIRPISATNSIIRHTTIAATAASFSHSNVNAGIVQSLLFPVGPQLLLG